jgi:hypothetical protein
MHAALMNKNNDWLGVKIMCLQTIKKKDAPVGLVTFWFGLIKKNDPTRIPVRTRV